MTEETSEIIITRNAGKWKIEPEYIILPTANICKNFSMVELVGIQEILASAARTGDFANARRLLKLAQKESLLNITEASHYV